jgi:catechol 2,3-dioxygenase-like lactoylglutathione lyase family enzyme
MNAKSAMNSSDPIKELPLAPRAVTHIGLTVTDLDQAIAFYEKVFGFRVVFGPTRFQSDDPQFGAIPSDFFGADFKSTCALKTPSNTGRQVSFTSALLTQMSRPAPPA